MKGIKVTPIKGQHSDRFEVTGYRIGRVAYLTDFKQISEQEIKKLEGVDTLVVNALRWRDHISHFTVEEALGLIAHVKPHRAFLTHMSHDIGLHALATERLPQGVQLAYDTLSIEIDE